ncbi:hypothetical protein IU479_31455 [Nocardia abscessus]|uniref:hypothetical protein n=1 Tax=Nocardia TaxID=1817 RepID=UPI0018957450|nr:MULTISPECIES: hypothetical protein [Nocardia]MBF6222613.1 hypothetical protein [Nocardia abscessus]MDE1672985.1 hypothetical protein [Nocardia gipuzkoensis]
MTTDRWFPPLGEVHIRIWLAGQSFDYTVAATAVHNLIEDWTQKHWCTIELIRDSIEVRGPLPRLPCERLFLGPSTSPQD